MKRPDGYTLLGPGVALGILLVGAFTIAGRIPQGLELIALDIGQGDAILVRTALGDEVLIDGGPDRRALSALGDVLLPWDRTLSGVIVTHPDADHLTGIIEVLRRYRVGWVGMTGVVREGPLFASLLDVLAQRGVPVVELREGDVIDLRGEASLTALSPPRGRVPVKQNINATSLVLVLSDKQGRHRALLMGDAERDVEHRLIAGRLIPDVDVLKVGHHGSRFGTGVALLQAADPELAVISAGAGNRYGHPAPTVLERLRSAGTEVWVTSRNGAFRYRFAE